MRKLMKSAAEAFLNWARRQATGMREIMEILVEAVRLPAIPVLVVGIAGGLHFYLANYPFVEQATWWLFVLVLMQQLAIDRLSFLVGRLQDKLGLSDEELERPPSRADGPPRKSEDGETKMTESELLELGKRLERVERSVRRYRAALGIAGLLLAGGLLITATLSATGRALTSTSAPAQIVARSFVLVDANGRTRAELGIDALGPFLRLLDKAGNMRVTLDTAGEVPAPAVHDKAGNMRADGYLLGGPSLGLFDKAGKQRVTLGVVGDAPGLSLYDTAGNLRAALGTVPLENTATGSTETRAESSLVLFNQRGRVLWKAP
jgi:hypothetical protein